MYFNGFLTLLYLYTISGMSFTRYIRFRFFFFVFLHFSFSVLDGLCFVTVFIRVEDGVFLSLE